MSLVIRGIISINCGGDSIQGWKWNLTEINPESVFDRQPELWKPEWDSADTGASEQYYSYAEFAYEGPLPYKLIKYLLLPDASETSMDDVSVYLVQPSSAEIAYLNTRMFTPIPLLAGNELFSATLEFTHEKIFESLDIVRDGDILISEQRETLINGEHDFDPKETLFISNDVTYGLLSH